MQKPPHFFTQHLRAFSRSLPAKACLVWSGVIPIFLATPSLAQSNEIELPQFFDVSNHWAEACIEGVGKDKLMSGYLDRSFRPDGTMTRAEFAAAIVKAFPNAPMVRERGFLAGYPGNLFRPNQAISRVQAMVIIANTQAHLGIEVSADSDEAVLNRFFEDAIAIPNYARKAIARATRDSLVVSYPNAKQLRHNDSITRGEATALLCRVNENGSDACHYVAAD
ncbi:MAG: S-layer homology domain-containing protein [Phormidesmis sp.]